MEEFPEGFDLETLLAPVPGEAPAGTDLRADADAQSLYRRLRAAREDARANERQVDSGGDNADTAATDASANWRTIRSLAPEALVQSKDLQIAAWYTEALLRSDELVGVAAGFRLMTGLVETCWDDLFPFDEEEGVAAKVRPVSGLNGESREGTLIQPLRKITLFVRPNGAPLQYWQYLQSAQLSTIDDEERRRELSEAKEVLPLESFEAEARLVETEAQAAGRSHFATLRRRAAAAGAAWQALCEALDSRAGADAPPSSRIRNLLTEIEDLAGQFATAEEPSEEAGAPTETEPGADTEAGAAATSPRAGIARGGIGSREEALRALAAIADYFLHTEPLSPLAYTLQEAVRRSRMSWPELLEEIVPDVTQRSAILTSLGIRPPPME